MLATLIPPSADSQATALTSAVKQKSVATVKNKTSLNSDENHTITHHNNRSVNNEEIYNCNATKETDQSVLRTNVTNTNTPSRICLEKPTLNDSVTSDHYVNTSAHRLSPVAFVNGNANGVQQPRTHFPNVSEESKAMSDASVAVNKSGQISRRCSAGLNVTIASDGEIEVAGDASCDLENNTSLFSRNKSPPFKKKRQDNFLFRRCFNSTYDPSGLPGFGVILAENSDSED